MQYIVFWEYDTKDEPNLIKKFSERVNTGTRARASKAGVVSTLILASLVYVQLILGGAVLLRTVNPTWISQAWVEAHVHLGHSIWFIAIIPAVLFWRLKPPSKPLKISSITLVILSFIQSSIIGVMDPWGNVAVMAAHGLMAGLVFAIAVALTVITLKELRARNEKERE